MTLKPQKGVLLNFSQFLAATHISTVNCDEMAGDKLRQPAYEFFFQAEDGIRDFCLSRGLGDVYKRQSMTLNDLEPQKRGFVEFFAIFGCSAHFNSEL